MFHSSTRFLLKMKFLLMGHCNKKPSVGSVAVSMMIKRTTIPQTCQDISLIMIDDNSPITVQKEKIMIFSS